MSRLLLWIVLATGAPVAAVLAQEGRTPLDPPLRSLVPNGTALWIEGGGYAFDLAELREQALGVLRLRELLLELAPGVGPSDDVERAVRLLQLADGIERGPIGRALHELAAGELAVGWRGEDRFFALARLCDAERAEDLHRRFARWLGPALAIRGRHLVLASSAHTEELLAAIPFDGRSQARGLGPLMRALPSESRGVLRGGVDLRTLPLQDSGARESADVLGTLLVQVLVDRYRTADAASFVLDAGAGRLVLDVRWHGAGRELGPELRDVLALGRAMAPTLPRDEHTVVHFRTRRDFGALIRHREELAGTTSRRQLDALLSQLELAFQGLSAEAQLLPDLKPGMSFAVQSLDAREASRVPGLELPAFAFGLGHAGGRLAGAADAALRFLVIAGNEQRAREGKTKRRLRAERLTTHRVTVAELVRVRGGRPVPVEDEIEICLARGEEDAFLTTRHEYARWLARQRDAERLGPWPETLLDELHVDFVAAAAALARVRDFAADTLLLQRGIEPERTDLVFDTAARLLPLLGHVHVCHVLEGEDLCWRLDWTTSDRLGALLAEAVR